MARRTLILVALGLSAAAACVPMKPPPPPPPPPPTQLCGLGFNSTSDYQAAFDKLGRTNTGWITADGFVPPVLPDGRAQLPDGRVAWWMSDTTTGTANPDNSVSNRGNVHNSTVEQGGGCLTPHLDLIPQSGAAWHWPGAAVVTDNTLKIFSAKVVAASGPPGFDWRVVGTSVASFSLPSLQLIAGPTDLPTNQTSGGEAIPWGIRSFFKADEGMVYMYGRTGGLFTAQSWLARVPSGQETTVGAWQFFTDAPGNNPWSPNFVDAKPMEFQKSDGSDDGPPIAQLSVVPYGNRYLAGAFTWDTVAPDIRAWVADTPWGPWVQQPSNVATFQRRTNEQIAYDARIAKLPGPGWTVAYSVNDPIKQQQDFTLYRGQFAAPSGLPSP
jgi:hypothetical protein